MLFLNIDLVWKVKVGGADMFIDQCIHYYIKNGNCIAVLEIICRVICYLIEVILAIL